MKQTVFLNGIVLTLVWYFLFACPALAYFDLNFSNYLLQLFFGFGLAFWLSFKSILTNKFFKNNRKETKTQVTEESDASH